MRRVASMTAAAVLTAASGIAAAFALALSPLGDGLRERVFDVESGFCSAQWLELAQLPLPFLALAASAAALHRTARRRASPRWYLIAALLLLVAWWSIGAAGDCAIGGDD